MKRAALFLVTIGITSAVVCPQICARGAGDVFTGTFEVHQKMARGMDVFVDRDLSVESFSTGSATFDGEWLFGTYLMAGLGYLQTARQHPALRAEHVRRAEQCVDAILSKHVRAFDTKKWHEDALTTLEHGDGHAAYLGYLGLLLGVLRDVEPTTRFVPLHDEIVKALAERVARSPIAIIETYPDELYPIDNLAVYAALSLGKMDAELDDFRRRYVDPTTGLLVQAVAHDGKAIDEPRGSGTALGAYFAAFFAPKFSAELHTALDRHLGRSAFGFGTVREYLPGRPGRGDIDSGPILFGAGLSATGFSFATVRRHGDEDRFRTLWRTATLWGAPFDDGERYEWVNGGPLGNAIMFAMTTAEVAR